MDGREGICSKIIKPGVRERDADEDKGKIFRWKGRNV